MPSEPLSTPLTGDDRGERAELHALLWSCRARIDPQRSSLGGGILRLPARIGKAVSQEEAAEAIGISRQWYAQLETGQPSRFSPKVLARVADTLLMDPAERAALFRLTVPELRFASLGVPRAMLEAYGSLRRLIRPLWAATTEGEALTAVREHAVAQFRADLLLTVVRSEDGRWEWEGCGRDAELDRHASYHAVARERLVSVDEFHAYPLMMQPGQLLTRSQRDSLFPAIAAGERPLLEDHDWTDVSWFMVHIELQTGRTARMLPVHDTARAYSDVELAQLSTLAELASLALSGGTTPQRRGPASDTGL